MSAGRDTPPMTPYGAPDWKACATHWPNSDKSRFWNIDGFVWHVQRFGAGPPLLLIHGSGAACHSWRQLSEVLKESFEVICVDLPGHGFTQSAQDFKPSLPNVSRALGRLLQAMNVEPEGVIGHSAGAAIAITMVDLGIFKPKMLVSINGALQPFDGPLSIAAPLIAKLAAATSGPAWLIAKRAINIQRVGRLIRDTGSDPEQIDTHLYKMLFCYPAHIRGTLKMMAHWELSGVRSACSRLAIPALFISADRDRAIGPSIAAQAAKDVQNGTLVRLKGLGHLAHEEDSASVAEAVLAHWTIG